MTPAQGQVEFFIQGIRCPCGLGEKGQGIVPDLVIFSPDIVECAVVEGVDAEDVMQCPGVLFGFFIEVIHAEHVIDRFSELAKQV